MANTIITKNSSTAAAVPTAGQLVQGELAVNVTDKRVFTENAAGAVVELGVNPSSVTTGALAYTGTLTGGTGVVNIGSGQVYKDASGNLGIGTISPAYKLTVQSGGATILAGADNGVDTLTDATQKIMRFGVPHYTNAEEPVGALFGSNTSTVNNVFIGGGTGVFNAATLVSFYTAANTTTTTGSERMRITAAGSVGINTSSPSANLSVRGGASNASDLATAYSLAAFNIQPKSTSGYSLQFGSGSGDLPYIQMSAGGAASGNLLIQPYGGNVGINTTAPSAALEVSGGIKLSGQLRAGVSGSVYSPLVSAAYIAGTSNLYLRHIGGFNRIDSYNDPITGTIPLQLNASVYRFYISDSEKMRLDTGGNLLVGTTSASFAGYTFKFSVTEGSAVTPAGINNVAGGVGASNCLIFARNGTQTGSISVTGTTTSYGTSSDYRLKEDWVAVADASTRVNALKPINFAWISSGERVDGFLAHELAEVVPEAVTGTKDAVNAEGKPVYQGIDQSKLVPLLTAALQEALAKIESLEARLDAANI